MKTTRNKVNKTNIKLEKYNTAFYPYSRPLVHSFLPSCDFNIFIFRSTFSCPITLTPILILFFYFSYPVFLRLILIISFHMALNSLLTERLYYFQHPVHIILRYVLQSQFSIILPETYVALTCFPSHRLYCFHSVRPGRQYSIMYSSAYS